MRMAATSGLETCGARDVAAGVAGVGGGVQAVGVGLISSPMSKGTMPSCSR